MNDLEISHVMRQLETALLAVDDAILVTGIVADLSMHLMLGGDIEYIRRVNTTGSSRWVVKRVRRKAVSCGTRGEVLYYVQGVLELAELRRQKRVLQFL